MTRVKICGITRLEDALAAAAAGADAIGLIFWPGTARCVPVEAAAEIAAALPPYVARVGVFVDQPVAEMRAIRERVGLSVIQLHGDEPPEVAAALPGPVIKAFRGTLDPGQAARYRACAFLADGAPPGMYGGAGLAAEAAMADGLRAEARYFVLAGGLTPDNVAARIRRFRPDAVDVAGGVETAPGRKDPALIRAFIAAVRAAG